MENPHSDLKPTPDSRSGKLSGGVGKILKLPESTVRMIAAGEVITRPVNVVKELLENSIDAGSTNIRICIEQGGTKLIEITDNGHGIALANADLLCSRHATSKISSASDLSAINTFGFRGEALASISQVANVEVKSFNIKVDSNGWQAKYKYGQLVGPPESKYVQNAGTQIKITNLFDEVVGRKSATQSNLAQERKAIIDLVNRYAIHYRETITMSMQEGNSNDLVCFLAPTTSRACVGSIYGTELEGNVVEFSFNRDEEFKADVECIFSHRKAVSSTIGPIFILFVNNRLVECLDLKRELDTLLQEYLNPKNYTIFIYLSLRVPAQDVDVNAHPSKATVILHYQTVIIAMIVAKFREKLDETLRKHVLETNTSTQTITVGKLIQRGASPSQMSQYSSTTAFSPDSQKSINQDRMSILAPSCVTKSSQASNFTVPSKRPHDLIHNDPSQQTLTQMGYSNRKMTPPSSPLVIPPERVRRELKLQSLFDLRQQVAEEKSIETAKVIKNSSFIGIFDHYSALVQHETKLYAINLKAFLKEQYYQFYLYDVGNFPPIEILPPGNKIKHMVELYLNDIKKHEVKVYESLKFNTYESIMDKLAQHAALLEDYLSITFTRDEVLTIPCLMPNEVPNLVFLGKFLSELANTVNYSQERECLRTLGRVVADFYSEPPANLADKETQRRYRDLVDTKLYVAIKNYLLIPEWLFNKENMVQISDTRDLYKVFERC